MSSAYLNNPVNGPIGLNSMENITSVKGNVMRTGTGLKQSMNTTLNLFSNQFIKRIVIVNIDGTDSSNIVSTYIGIYKDDVMTHKNLITKNEPLISIVPLEWVNSSSYLDS
jgi:hypothetical protein